MIQEDTQLLKVEPGTYLLVVDIAAAPITLLASVQENAKKKGINLLILRVYGGVDTVRLLRAESAETLKVEGED